MLKVIEKNLLDITEGIICHQVNCQGVMGSGIAAAIRSKYPKVYNFYQEHCYANPKHELLGDCHLVEVSDNLFVANMFCQFSYGRDKSKVYTNYTAVSTAFINLAATNCNKKDPVYIPYMMGCGLGGGNWDKYSGIIHQYIPNAIICKLKDTK